MNVHVLLSSTSILPIELTLCGLLFALLVDVTRKSTAKGRTPLCFAGMRLFSGLRRFFDQYEVPLNVWVHFGEREVLLGLNHSVATSDKSASNL